MKAAITDEHADYVSIIDGPEDIIKNLKGYLLEFDRYGHPACWGTEEFVIFLNDVILRERDEKVTIVDLWTNKYDKSLYLLRI